MDEVFAVGLGFFFEFDAELFVWGDAFEFVIVDDGGNVEAGASNEHWDMAASLDFSYFFQSEVAIFGHGERFLGISDANEMVRNAFLVFGLDEIGGNVHVEIDLAGVGGNDFAVDSFGYFKR